MSSYRSSHRAERDRDENRGSTSTLEEPPMSRLFVICNKSQTEEDVRDAFKNFGDIEEVWVVKDKATGENKGTQCSIDCLNKSIIT